MLATGKGQILPVLAMLAAKQRLRAGPVPAPSGAVLALRCAPCRTEGVGTKGVPTHQLPASGQSRTKG